MSRPAPSYLHVRGSAGTFDARRDAIWHPHSHRRRNLPLWFSGHVGKNSESEGEATGCLGQIGLFTPQLIACACLFNSTWQMPRGRARGSPSSSMRNLTTFRGYLDSMTRISAKCSPRFFGLITLCTAPLLILHPFVPSFFFALLNAHLFPSLPKKKPPLKSDPLSFLTDFKPPHPPPSHANRQKKRQNRIANTKIPQRAYQKMLIFFSCSSRIGNTNGFKGTFREREAMPA